MSVNVVNIDDPDEGHPVRFISWNVKGLNGPVKRAKVFSHLKQLKPDILFFYKKHISDWRIIIDSVEIGLVRPFIPNLLAGPGVWLYWLPKVLNFLPLM